MRGVTRGCACAPWSQARGLAPATAAAVACSSGGAKGERGSSGGAMEACGLGFWGATYNERRRRECGARAASLWARPSVRVSPVGMVFGPIGRLSLEFLLLCLKISKFLRNI